MFSMSDNHNMEFGRARSPIGIIIDERFAEQNSENFNELEFLIKLSECMEREQNEFWARDPDPFDDRSPKKIPNSGVFADIANDLQNNIDFIYDIIRKFITNHDPNIDNDKRRVCLRFLCSLFNCISLKDLDPEPRDSLYDRLFELAQSEYYPTNVYCIYLIGFFTRDDDQLLPQRKSSYYNIIEKVMNRLKHLNVKTTGSIHGILQDDDVNSNIILSRCPGTWNLSNPLKETIEERLLLFFLRHLAEFDAMMPSMLTCGVLNLIKDWILGNGHDDIRLTLEALRLLIRLLCHRVIYVDFFDRLSGIELLLKVPRPSVAANGISLCLYYLLYHSEMMDKFTHLTIETHEEVMKVLFWVIDTCQPIARMYAMLTVQCLIRQNTLLKLFERLSGPRYLLNTFTVMPSLFNDEKTREMRKDSSYYSLLRTTFNTMKICLEESLICWYNELDNESLNVEFDHFPSENETPFRKKVVTALSLALKLQTWRHPYIFDRSNIIRVIYSIGHGVLSSFFDDAFSNYNESIASALDVLSLLCISNKFIIKLMDFQENGTKTSVKLIFNLLLKRVASYTKLYIRALRSVLFFIGVVCYRPLNAHNKPIANTPLNKPSRKRKYDEINDNNNTNELNSSLPEKVFVSEQGDMPVSSLSTPISTSRYRSVNPIITPAPMFPTSIQPANSNATNPYQELQNKLWHLIRSYNLIPKLLKLIETAFSQLDEVAIRTWVCYILLGLARSEDILSMLNKLPVLNKGILEEKMQQTVTPEKQNEQTEYIQVARRLINKLSGRKPCNPAPINAISNVSTKHQIAAINSSTDANISSVHNYLVPFNQNLARIIDQNIFSGEDMTPDQLRRAEIVLSTQIQWKKDELNQIVHQYLISEGLNSTAQTLVQEAQLHNPPSSSSALQLYHQPTNNSAINMTFKPNLTLNGIVESFLRNQHFKCQQPTSICPPFSLQEPHKCLDNSHFIKPPQFAFYNIQNRCVFDTSRYTMHNRNLRKYVHKYFKPRIILNEMDVFSNDKFSDSLCFARGLDDGLFFASMDHVIVFTDVDFAHTSLEIGECDFAISNLENSHDGRLLMASSVYNRRANNGVITLFDVSNRISNPTSVNKLKSYNYSGYCEFGKTAHTKMLLSQEKTARILDTETGEVLWTCDTGEGSISTSSLQFHPPVARNTYSSNLCATFDYSDRLILHNGALWDPRTSNFLLHQFDNLEDIFSGVFHPNGYEVIIGSAVWDIRKYRMLQNVPTLKYCRPRFNGTGDFFYAFKDYNNVNIQSNPMMQGQNLFQCFDSRDYSVVSTVNTNKVITSIAVDPKDLGVAVIESAEDYASQSQCRVYSIGYRDDSDSNFNCDDDLDRDEFDDDDDDDNDDEDDDDLDLDNTSDNLEFMMDLDNLMFEYSGDEDNDDDEDEDELTFDENSDDDQNNDDDDDNEADENYGFNSDSEYDIVDTSSTSTENDVSTNSSENSRVSSQ